MSQTSQTSLKLLSNKITAHFENDLPQIVLLRFIEQMSLSFQLIQQASCPNHSHSF